MAHRRGRAPSRHGGSGEIGEQGGRRLTGSLLVPVIGRRGHTDCMRIKGGWNTEEVWVQSKSLVMYYKGEGNDGQEGQREAQHIILPTSKRSTTTYLKVPANGRMPLASAACRLVTTSTITITTSSVRHMKGASDLKCCWIEWMVEKETALIHSAHHQGFARLHPHTHFLTHCTPNAPYKHSCNPHNCNHDADRCAQGPSAYVSNPFCLFWRSVAIPPLLSSLLHTIFMTILHISFPPLRSCQLSPTTLQHAYVEPLPDSLPPFPLLQNITGTRTCTSWCMPLCTSAPRILTS